MEVPEKRKTYYEENKERLKKNAREYHYKHRDKYIAYSKAYYQAHKDLLNERRRLARIDKPRPPRKRAHLLTPNPDPSMEERRKIFLSSLPPSMTTISQPLKVPSPEDFTVKFE